MTAAEPLFSQAVQWHRQGDRQRARRSYADLLSRHPRHASGWQMLGMLEFEERKFDVSLDCVQRSVELEPRNAHFVHNLGLVRRANGQLAEAERALRRSLDLLPTNSQALANLGLVLMEQGRFEEAIAALDESSRHSPPNDGAASMTQTNLGIAYSHLGRLEEALASYQRAVALNARNELAHANLGVMLQRMGRLEEAAVSLERAVDVNPRLDSSWSNLGVVLTHLARTDQAVAALRRAIALQSGAAGHWVNLGVALLDLGKVDEAIDSFREALRVDPQSADAWNNLGTSLKETGLLSEAADAYRTSIELRPDATVHSNLLFCLAYDASISQEELVAEHRVWAALYGWPADRLEPHVFSPDDLAGIERPLRIGYFSPDLRTHAVARFIEPVLACHDRRAVEVFAYAELSQPDDVTRRIQTLVPNWRWTHRLDDDALAAQIRADRIDILVDLAGHTGRNRLRALSRKPAPIQCLWMGYPTTTGLEAFDYLMTDEGMNPPDEPNYEVEQLYRLPCGSACFLPDPRSPPVAELPALVNGHMTFGSPHNLAKVNAGVLATWAAILKALPDARLLMFRGGLNGAVVDSLRARFAAAGGDPDRIDLRDVSNFSHGYEGYMRTYDEIDVCLDTFPANGGTTTCESLWMGVPWITLRGSRFFGRQTTSVLRHLELDDWIASTPEEYVARAVSWSARRSELASLRGDLRRRFAESTLGDTRKYTAGLEASFRDMWRRKLATLSG